MMTSPKPEKDQTKSPRSTSHGDIIATGNGQNFVGNTSTHSTTYSSNNLHTSAGFVDWGRHGGDTLCPPGWPFGSQGGAADASYDVASLGNQWPFGQQENNPFASRSGSGFPLRPGGGPAETNNRPSSSGKGRTHAGGRRTRTGGRKSGRQTTWEDYKKSMEGKPYSLVRGTLYGEGRVPNEAQNRSDWGSRDGQAPVLGRVVNGVIYKVRSDRATYHFPQESRRESDETMVESNESNESTRTQMQAPKKKVSVDCFRKEPS
jgi:hypothetical protein